MGQLHQLIKSSKGQLLVEILLAVALTAIMIPALLTGLFASKQGKAQQGQRIQAVALMKEAEEVVRNVREQGWGLFSINGTYHPLISGSSWTLASGSETIDGFVRTITVSNVYRNADGTIATSGGTLDTSTKKVELEVTWGQPYSSSVNSIVYVTRYLQNSAKSETSVADFDAGILADTAVTDSSGGEITLAPNTKGKWCSPSFSSANIALPDGPPVAVSATASANISSPNDIFVATSPTSANSFKLAHIKVTANTDPPVPTLRGKFTLDSAQYSNGSLVPVNPGLDNSFTTNAIKYYKSSSGRLYALIATTKPDREVIAILVDDNNSANDNTNDGEYQDYLNQIYKYWTFFDTKMYAGYSSATNTGFLNPSANAADSGGDGNGYDSNPTRAYSSNSSFAVDTNSGNNTGTNCTGSDKDKHRYYNYGFNIPTGSTINGIELRLDAKVDSTTGSPQMCVQLSWDGGTTWTTTKSTPTLTTNSTTYTLGGSADTWGRTWSDANFSNANFRVRVIDVASNNSRDFSLDWVATKVYYDSGALDQAPFDAGGTSIAVSDNTGYVTSGGYLYAFDLSNIDSKTTNSGLDMLGCRIQLDGYDCKPGSGTDRKYSSGQTGTTWSDTTSPAHSDCSDGGNIELFATNDIYPVKVGSSTYIYAAVGAGTNPEFNVANVSSIPTGASSPSISNNSCGRSSGGNAEWKLIGSYDFNSANGTEEAANSVYATPDGTRAYISSNGGDAKQFYILDTSSKSAPRFLSGTPSTGATSGYYLGTGANLNMYPRRSLTVFGNSRALLAGVKGNPAGQEPEEYQVINTSNEASPSYCGGINYAQGFNDLASVTETDNDKFVYMVSSSGGNQLKIIQGGPDGTYLDSGTYESAPQDLGSMVALNRLTVNSSVPANASLKFQVAATAPVNGSCVDATYIYVGPDGQADSYFLATGGPIPLTGISGFQNPAQCVRYKAFLSTTDYNVTPTILDASINYSP